MFLFFFWKKSRSVYKVCRYFFSVCGQKSFLMCDAENWERGGEKNKKRTNERIISDTAVFSGKKGVSIET